MQPPASSCAENGILRASSGKPPLYVVLRFRRFYIDMNVGKIYEKREKSLTVREECGNIFKQSAGRSQASEIGGMHQNWIREGGGTGRRARLRCVWFILGGSNPLSRTSKKLRKVDEISMIRGFFVLPGGGILPDTARYCPLLRMCSQNKLHDKLKSALILYEPVRFLLNTGSGGRTHTPCGTGT